MAGLDPKFIPDYSLEEYLVNKTNGTPLSGGSIEFWQDSDRIVPKPVYELTGAPPNYTYAALPNPITLSAVGTPQDANGNNVAIYYNPYDANGDIQLYYIVVKDSNGNVQFTRQGWPNITASNNPAGLESPVVNQVVNGQFADILFPFTNPLSIVVTGNSVTSVTIAPGWVLTISHSAGDTVTVQQNAIAGSSGFPGNPPYSLSVTVPGANVNSVTLTQTLYDNPDILSPSVGANNGYVATSVLLAPNSSLVIDYVPSSGTVTNLLTKNNVSGAYVQESNTVQLSPSDNGSAPPTGSVGIRITFPLGVTTTFSNLQVIGLESNVDSVPYLQQTVNQQISQEFYYYNPLLQYKPIPSYLVGWDFALNPAQATGHAIAASGGNFVSKQIWDQTILFQTAAIGPAISQVASGALEVTATNATQFALVQYIPQAVARKILNEPNGVSVNVRALTPAGHTLVGTVSLWYTTNANLPSTGADLSVPLTLDANGWPNSVTGGWNELTRNGLGNAQFTVQPSPNTTNFNDYGFNGWNLNGIGAASTATWMAIVVGFAQLPTGQTIDIASISLVPGQIPTIPAPQSPDEVLRECQSYYQSSFNQGTKPADFQGLTNAIVAIRPYSTYNAGGAPNYNSAGSAQFRVTMNSIPIVSIYNPTAGKTAGQASAYATGAWVADFTGTAAQDVGQNQFFLSTTGSPAYNVADTIAFSWSADSRLGL